MKMFTIYDTTSESYDAPITVRTTAEMERALSQLAEQDPQHKFIKFASEHQLFEIGQFDPQSGKTEIYSEKLPISNLSKYIQ